MAITKVTVEDDKGRVWWIAPERGVATGLVRWFATCDHPAVEFREESHMRDTLAESIAYIESRQEGPQT